MFILVLGEFRGKSGIWRRVVMVFVIWMDKDFEY